MRCGCGFACHIFEDRQERECPRSKSAHIKPEARSRVGARRSDRDWDGGQELARQREVTRTGLYSRAIAEITLPTDLV